MCSILLLSKISGGLNSIIDSARDSYCKYAIRLYDPIKPRTVQVPFKVNLSDILDLVHAEQFVDSSDEDTDEEIFDAPEMPLTYTDYRTIELLNLDPEIYYFFKHYNSNSVKDFDLMLQVCGITRKTHYSADLLHDDNKIVFKFEDEKIIAELY